MAEKMVRDFMTLWTTIDPVGTLVLFAALTAGLSDSERRATALRAIMYSAGVLLGAVVVGQVILTALGIRMISIQVAGGTILFIFSLQMVFGKIVNNTEPHSEHGHDMAVYPLAMPSIASPGAIMACMLLTDNSIYDIEHQAITSAIMLLILGITFLLMLFCKPILRLIGKNGASILIRVMGMLLAALSVELVMNALGVQRWLDNLP